MKRSSFIGLSLTAMLLSVPAWVCAEEPIDILRKNFDHGINVLEDPRYEDAGEKLAQRDKLCAITEEIFDPVLFVRLALASDWKKFTLDEQEEFTDLFSTFLCRYYLGRLQDHDGGERVNFTRQKFKSDTRVSIEGDVLWQGLEVPIEVRMVFRDEKWKAYDLVVSGISAVMLYRAQFRAVLREGSPAKLIEAIREKSDAAG